MRKPNCSASPKRCSIKGIAAFDDGDVVLARRLVADALDRGASRDEAQGMLDRIERLDAGQAQPKFRKRRPTPPPHTAALPAVAERAHRHRGGWAAESERRAKNPNLSDQGLRAGDAEAIRSVIRQVVDERESHLTILSQRTSATLSEVVQRSAPRQSDPSAALVEEQRQREFRENLLDLDQLVVESIYREAMTNDGPEHTFAATAIEGAPPQLRFAPGSKVPTIAPFIDAVVRAEASRARAQRQGVSEDKISLLENLETQTKIWTIVYGGLIADLEKITPVVPVSTSSTSADISDRIAEMARIG
ncbi:MAG TPA: hypothetical protein VNJ02_14500 [Vicinamibacterales bacterium]|nr:hypothetical protein [Vicinamibacterales bacterium]